MCNSDQPADLKKEIALMISDDPKTDGQKHFNRGFFGYAAKKELAVYNQLRVKCPDRREELEEFHDQYVDNFKAWSNC